MCSKEKYLRRVKIPGVREIEITAERLVLKLLELSKTETVCLLDSCGVGYLGSHLLVAGIRPLATSELTNRDASLTLAGLEQKLAGDAACIFTISYDFGLKLENIEKRDKEHRQFPEPDIYLAAFECLIVHDYDLNRTYLRGDERKFAGIESLLAAREEFVSEAIPPPASKIVSNFTRDEYLDRIEQIREYIRAGETYQTNLTQRFRVELGKDLSPQSIFRHLRENHPAPFAAFIRRPHDCVVSISPERFLKISAGRIETAPIKGTRPRGENPSEDARLRNELLASAKDLAENTMIVDLLRNDLGRICQYGSVRVEKLCHLEEHPTLFHLVSTVSGRLLEDAGYARIIRAVFPCGSITGCPKIRTMRIIDELETAERGLSMGAIGYLDFDKTLEMSVAIRTLVIRRNTAVFNVGGGIVSDSDPAAEYDESLVKAKAIFRALGVEKF
jgi:para-aminobenzoate synthetase component I